MEILRLQTVPGIFSSMPFNTIDDGGFLFPLKMEVLKLQTVPGIFSSMPFNIMDDGGYIIVSPRVIF